MPKNIEVISDNLKNVYNEVKEKLIQRSKKSVNCTVIRRDINKSFIVIGHSGRVFSRTRENHRFFVVYKNLDMYCIEKDNLLLLASSSESSINYALYCVYDKDKLSINAFYDVFDEPYVNKKQKIVTLVYNERDAANKILSIKRKTDPNYKIEDISTRYQNLENVYEEFISFKNTDKMEDLEKQEDELQQYVDSFTLKNMSEIEFHGSRHEAIIERLDEKNICIRMFYKQPKKIIEIFRLYCSKKTAILSQKNRKGEFVALSINDIYTANSLKLFGIFKLDKQEDLLEGTFAKYYLNHMISKSFGTSIDTIVILKKYPFIEKLYNANFKKLALSIFSYFSKIQNRDNTVVDIFPDKKGSLNKEIGLNNYQIEYFEKKSEELGQYNYFAFTTLSFLKRFFQKKDISTIDNNTFDKVIDYSNYFMKYKVVQEKDFIYKEYSRKLDYNKEKYVSSLKDIKIFFAYYIPVQISESYGIKYAINYLPIIIQLHKISKQSTLCYGSVPSFYQYFMDSIDMIHQMIFCEEDQEGNPVPELELPKKDFDQMTRFHTRVNGVFNTKKMEIDESKFLKIQKELEYFTYKGDNYSIIAPKKTSEIMLEGSSLNHCVGSYVNKVISRKTNIVFFRKNEKIDEPYFTIEVDPQGVIQQIHGKHNKNLENIEERDFIEKWAKEKKLTIGRITQVR